MFAIYYNKNSINTNMLPSPIFKQIPSTFFMFQSSTVPNFVYNFTGYVNGLKNFLLHRHDRALFNG